VRDASGTPEALVPIPNAAYEEARRQASCFLRRNGVVSVAIGTKVTGGEDTGRLAIVVTVDDKIDPGALHDHRRRPLPKKIPVRVGGREYEIPVDVRDSRGREVGELQGLVSRRVNHRGLHCGAVGAVVERDGEAFVLTAGHVAVEEERRLSVDDRIHRAVLQLEATALEARKPFTRAVRREIEDRLTGFPRKRGNSRVRAVGRGSRTRAGNEGRPRFRGLPSRPSTYY